MGNNDIPINISDLFEQVGSGPSVSFSEMVEQKKLELGITDFQMSKILGIPKNTFYRMTKRISEGDVESLDYFSIIKISQLFNLDVQDLTKTYVGSLNSEHIGQIEDARKANYILRTFDVKGLKDLNFISSTTDFQHIENRIKSFFHLDSIFDYSHEVGRVLFSKLHNSNDKMRELWVRSAFFQFEKIENTNEFNREVLLSLVKNIRPYTRYEEKGFLTVIRALFGVGITVIVQPSPPKAKVRGGTFVVNGRPCIAITDYNNNYATLWFALMHELFHVLNDLDQLKVLKYALTEDGAADLFLLQEEDADWFAREMLFPREFMNYIKHLINSPTSVAKYAEEKRVHPAIIYSFFCYEANKEMGKNLYGLYQQYFGKTDTALRSLKTNPFGKESIFEEISLIKKRLTVETN
ncbi:ImmA/IrrE family metallo-endopeptidase [Dyadobacter pollutisoli]|uniref:ImmA/IrrE family metallo-endopeptidase n=1 Tax=Dyadobacter pollutisoli TaxID=2910158 RepID=A0A9E8N7Q3_9BACT|nr:ImmA/IrrE family metallo-endopeptidase [Dyadobacter pollutisoli]WAC11434.1 ImmA/IrrE family metallo-endopeptidase [Dyadobacter pollutisoli]